MKRERALRIREILQIALQKLDDDLALEVIELYDAWKPGMKLELQKKVRDEGKLYKVMQEHVANEAWKPADTPELFQEIVSFADAEVVQEWEAGAKYNKNEKVIYESTVRQSLIDKNMYRPDDARGWITLF